MIMNGKIGFFCFDAVITTNHYASLAKFEKIESSCQVSS